MANFTDEKKYPLPAERPHPEPQPEIRPEPEIAPSKEAAAKELMGEKPSTLEEAGARMKEMLGLKRRPKPTAILSSVRDEVAVKIEKIMEEGLSEAYSRLSPVARQEFKLKGEETARSIRELLRATHVKVKKIFRLILDWLKLLPGINRFFLEQEAKIKTDRIITLHQNKK